MISREASTIVNRYAHDEEIDRLLLDLLRYPTPQTDRLESDPQINKFIAGLVVPYLAELTGIPGTIDAMGNLIWRLGNPGSRGLMLMGYTMTFPAGSMLEPFSGTEVDGQSFGLAGPCVLGRGACEQKGALAAMIYAVAIVTRAQSALKAPLTLAVSVAGETGRHDAAEFIMRNDMIEARAAIIGLGTSNRICLGNKGRIDIDVTVRGKAAHSSMPWEGLNAVDGFRRAMDRLDRVPLGASHHGLGKASLAVTQVKSGPEISHTIPDICRAVLDRRLLPGEDPDRAFCDIQEALKEVFGYNIAVQRGAFMYPSEVEKTAGPVTAIAEMYRALTGKEADFFYSPAALDAGYLNRMGIETIMFGPGDLRFAHTDQEVVALPEVRDAAKIFAATALHLLG